MSRGVAGGEEVEVGDVGADDASAARGGRPGARRPGRAVASSSGRRKTPARLGRRRSTSISRVRSPARAQVAARFRAVVLLPSPALALVTSRVTIGPRRSATPEQAGAEVAEGVGLDRVGRAGGPEVAAAMDQRRPPDPRDHARRAAGSARASGARGPSPSGRGARAGRPGRCPGRSSGRCPCAMFSARLGRTGIVGSATLAGSRPGPSATARRISKSAMLPLHLGDPLDLLLRAPRAGRGTSGARASTPASRPSSLLAVSSSSLDLARACCVEDHLRGVGRPSAVCGRAVGAVELVHDLVELLGGVLAAGSLSKWRIVRLDWSQLSGQLLSSRLELGDLPARGPSGRPGPSVRGTTARSRPAAGARRAAAASARASSPSSSY